ncbi:unnamed protein product [Lepidochelys kempii]
MPHRPIDLQVICVSAGNQDHRSQGGRNIHRPLWFSCCVCECQSLEPNHKQTPSVVSRCRRGTSPTEQCWGNIPASEAEMGMQIVWMLRWSDQPNPESGPRKGTPSPAHM